MLEGLATPLPDESCALTATASAAAVQAKCPTQGIFTRSGLTLSQHTMDHQRVSEICFDEVYVVPSDQTARALFTRLPHGRGYASTLIECFATGYLIAVVESICIREMQRHIDSTVEVPVGHNIQIVHCGPIPSGATIRLSGWVEQLGTRSATFCVRAYDDHELVCDGKVTIVAADRLSIESRIATKVSSLQNSGTVACDP